MTLSSMFKAPLNTVELAEVSVAILRSAPLDIALLERVERLTSTLSPLAQALKEGSKMFEEGWSAGVDSEALPSLLVISEYSQLLIQTNIPPAAQQVFEKAVLTLDEFASRREFPEPLHRFHETIRLITAEIVAIQRRVKMVNALQTLSAAPLDLTKAQSAWEAYKRGETSPLEPGYLTRQK